MNLILAMILLYMVKMEYFYGTLKLEEKYTYDKEKKLKMSTVRLKKRIQVSKKYMKKGMFI